MIIFCIKIEVIYELTKFIDRKMILTAQLRLFKSQNDHKKGPIKKLNLVLSKSMLN